MTSVRGERAGALMTGMESAGRSASGCRRPAEASGGSPAAFACLPPFWAPLSIYLRALDAPGAASQLLTGCTGE